MLEDVDDDRVRGALGAVGPKFDAREPHAVERQGQLAATSVGQFLGVAIGPGDGVDDAGG
jgi:hypothetical protein